MHRKAVNQSTSPLLMMNCIALMFSHRIIPVSYNGLHLVNCTYDSTPDSTHSLNFGERLTTFYQRHMQLHGKISSKHMACIHFATTNVQRLQPRVRDVVLYYNSVMHSSSAHSLYTRLVCDLTGTPADSVSRVVRSIPLENGGVECLRGDRNDGK